MLSVIIPTFNEENNIANIKKIVNTFNEHEVLIVDGGSTDNTIQALKKNKINFIVTSPNRGKQLKLGANNSKGNWLFFLHADSIINQINVMEIKEFMNNKNKNNVGYFRLSFKSKSFVSILVAFWANFRTRLLRLPFGDQGLIIERKNYLKVGLHKEIEIMEDLDFIIRIPFKNRLFLETYIITSFKKYKKNGIFKQGIKHLACQLLFFLGINNKIIFKFYHN